MMIEELSVSLELRFAVAAGQVDGTCHQYRVVADITVSIMTNVAAVLEGLIIDVIARFGSERFGVPKRSSAFLLAVEECTRKPLK